MIILLDTHLLLWAAYTPDRLPASTRDDIDNDDNTLLFSAASIWEVSIKSSLGRADFDVDPYVLRRGLIENAYVELPVTAAHAAAVRDLPAVHRDPFDRMLVAQARVEGVTLQTNDRLVAAYGSPARLVA
ncbi:type II toxin-antitoxin system VapC family toxin [Microbacterium sp.]|uniref:type II toxin-antitoxin system VapC family toxin n=1 Tax=Microbacterium sp. TaxID=51671 RepID=UPI003A8E8B7D